jgi:hypothetical protein
LAAGTGEDLPWDDGSEFKIKAWEATYSVRGLGGYKDNVLLSGVRPEGSGFAVLGADVFLMRLPIDGPEVSVLLSAEDRHYFEVAEANEEATVVANASVKQRLGEGWLASVQGQYFFMNQVFDASLTEVDVGVVVARGHGLSGRPGVSRSLGYGTWLDFEYPFTRQYFDTPLDNYWEGAARLALRHGFGVRSEVGVSYENGWRAYDTRERVTAEGVAEAGTRLGYEVQRAEASWRQHWDARKRWRTVLRLGLESNKDDGSGYFDYQRCYVSGQVRFQGWGWEAQVQASYGDYGYAVQTVGDGDNSLRSKGLYGFGARVARGLGHGFKGYAEYEFERSVSNRAIDEYQVSTVSGGIEWEF